MSERENIMNRIRVALKAKVTSPGSHGVAGHALPAAQPGIGQVQQWLPAGGETVADQVEFFRSRSAELKTEFHWLASPAEAQATLAKIAAEEKWSRIATHTGELTDRAAGWLHLPVLKTTGGYDVHELEACDAGITECQALVAQMGSVIVTSRDSGGRALSVLPPHHVVLARRDQLVRDLSAGFALVQKKYASDYPSMISVVTGPSRTGDIERILVLGAHGPKKLTILCW